VAINRLHDGGPARYTYDSNNNLLSESVQVDATATATTSYTYNSFGEVLTMMDPLGNVSTNTYDANGNLLTVTLMLFLQYREPATTVNMVCSSWLFWA